MALSGSPDWTPAWVAAGKTTKNRRISRKINPFLPLLSSPRDLNLIATTTTSCSSSNNNTNSQPTVSDQNSMICRLMKNPQTAESGFECYEKAKKNPGFIPQESTLTLLARYFIGLKNWSSISSLAGDFRAFNVLPDSPTFCSMISSCVKARKFKIVNCLLETVIFDQETASRAFEFAMKGYNKLHMYTTTVDLFQRMKSDGLVVLEPGCYCAVMEAYLKMGQHEKVVSIFEEFEEREDGPSQCDAKIYLLLCDSLGKMGRPFDSLNYFRESTRKGIPEDPMFYSSLIRAFAAAGEVKMAEELVEEAESKRLLRPDESLYMRLVQMYVAEGMLDNSFGVVSLMRRVKARVSDCISCTIVNAFSRQRGPREAAKVYEELQSLGCKPGQVTYASMLNIYNRIGAHSEAETTFAEMEQKGFNNCVVAYATMINMYGKTGRHRDAMKVLARMKKRGCEPNVWVYNSLLDIHGKALDLRQMEKIWKEMKRRGVSPDRVSYTSVISAYSKAKEYDKCVEYYHNFKTKAGNHRDNGKIDRALGGIMVGVFSKTNALEELVKLLQEMKGDEIELDERLYVSALNTFRDSGLVTRVKWLQDNFSRDTVRTKPLNA
ncbi:unnamed protein product [Cuscuta campestris]|uniref:Pentacotripeptide-repeat region of PRORP domain-containing protein n=2 Tax=Cuscuta sect. Cleistogrammica TaxID=1824901 RepID=A0A484MF40_9ASTE|nr:hypothetical protein DM860_001732 [Cuscuta australis]VFQ87533.1 unnamed protein product [Cuscuta campestris]